MVIRMRHTRAHTANRRSHHALKTPNLATCSNCEAKHRPHHMCPDCGFYKGRMVMDLKAKKEAREARLQAKRERIEGQQQEAEAMPEAAPAIEPTEEKTEKDTLEAEVKDEKKS